MGSVMSVGSANLLVNETVYGRDDDDLRGLEL